MASKANVKMIRKLMFALTKQIKWVVLFISLCEMIKMSEAVGADFVNMVNDIDDYDDQTEAATMPPTFPPTTAPENGETTTPTSEEDGMNRKRPKKKGDPNPIIRDYLRSKNPDNNPQSISRRRFQDCDPQQQNPDPNSPIEPQGPTGGFSRKPGSRRSYNPRNSLRYPQRKQPMSGNSGCNNNAQPNSRSLGPGSGSQCGQNNPGQQRSLCPPCPNEGKARNLNQENPVISGNPYPGLNVIGDGSQPPMDESSNGSLPPMDGSSNGPPPPMPKNRRAKDESDANIYVSMIDDPVVNMGLPCTKKGECGEFKIESPALG